MNKTYSAMSVQGKTNFILIRELISEIPEDSTRIFKKYIYTTPRDKVL